MEEVHSPENCWLSRDGGYIPFSEMSDAHLRRAKRYAQSKEEFYWRKMGDWSERVALIDAEAERRGIVIKDKASKFYENTKVLKAAIEKIK